MSFFIFPMLFCLFHQININIYILLFYKNKHAMYAYMSLADYRFYDKKQMTVNRILIFD